MKKQNTFEKPHDKVKEPLIHLVKRTEMKKTQAWAIRIAGVLLGMLVSALFIMLITGLNPVSVYASMFSGNFGTTGRIWQTLKDMALLLCIAIGLAPAFKLRFWNVGAEGQVLIGSLVTAACMIYLKTLPQPLLILVMLIGALIAGSVWAGIPAFFKAKWNTNETLFTLMMRLWRSRQLSASSEL